MAGIRELHGLMRQLDDQLATCMRCGMCQAVCPLYAETGREAQVARGKIALLEQLAADLTEDAVGVRERLESCLLCGSCAANCPSGVKVLDIFLKARAILAGYLGLPPAKRAIFRTLLARPKLFNFLTGLASRLQGLAVKPVNEVVGSSCARFASPLGDRHFPALAGTPLHGEVPSLDQAAGKSGLRAAFFPGCMVDKVYPRVGLATLKVLAHHGVGVYMPAEQACCGMPALASGDRPAFENLVRLNLKLFAGRPFDALITPCATCTAAIKEAWPAMTADWTGPEREQVLELAGRTMDLNAFLADKVGLPPVPAPAGERTRVTYHDPCHLKKSLKVSAQPRALIARNPGCELVEMADADVCCGCGGSFTLLHPELSANIGRRKRDNIVATGARVAVTSCPACMLQITDMLSRAGDDVEVRHPVELYAQTLP